MIRLRTLLLFIGLISFISLFYFFYTRSSAKMNEQNGLITKDHKPEKIIEGKQDILQEMPKFPMYPGMTVEKSFKRTVGQNISYYLFIDASVGVQDLISFYKTELTKDGWTIVDILPSNNQIGEGAIDAAKNNMNVLINFERESSTEPAEIIINLFIKQG